MKNSKGVNNNNNNLEKKESQMNGQNKEIDDDAQGLTPERWHRLCVKKRRGKNLSVLTPEEAGNKTKQNEDQRKNWNCPDYTTFKIDKGKIDEIYCHTNFGEKSLIWREKTRIIKQFIININDLVSFYVWILVNMSNAFGK